MSSNNTVALWVCNAKVCGHWTLVPAGETPECDLRWDGHITDRTMRRVWEGVGQVKSVFLVGSGEYEQWGPVMAFEKPEDAEAVAEAMEDWYTAGEIEGLVQ